MIIAASFGTFNGLENMKKLLVIAGVLTTTLLAGALISSTLVMRGGPSKTKVATNPLTVARATKNVKTLRQSNAIKPTFASQPQPPAGLQPPQPLVRSQPLRTTVTQANFVQGHQPTIQKSQFNPTPTPARKNGGFATSVRQPNQTSQNRKANSQPPAGSFSTPTPSNSLGQPGNSPFQTQPTRKPIKSNPTSGNQFGRTQLKSNGFKPPVQSKLRAAPTHAFAPQNRVASKASMWPTNAKNVKNLVRTEYSLPQGAADSIVDFFAADNNKEIETRITKPEKSDGVFVQLVVTTDEKTQRAIASFLDAVYSAKRIESLKQANKPNRSEEAENHAFPDPNDKVNFRESQLSDQKNSFSDTLKSRELEREVKIQKQNPDTPKKSENSKNLGDLLDEPSAVAETIKEIRALIGPTRNKRQTPSSKKRTTRQEY